MGTLTQESKPLEVGRGPLSGQSILVVEDEPLLALELNFTLRDAGATVFVSTDGETAIRAIEMLGTSAAVLDINLGQKDCSAVCERLSDIGIPFVFFTGEARPDIMLRWPNTPMLTKLASKQRIIGVLAGVTIAAENRRDVAQLAALRTMSAATP
jgi:CheY-like chemotaxis protein